MTDSEEQVEDVRALKEMVLNAGEKFRSYRFLFLLWGIVILFDASISQMMVSLRRVALIPFVWVPTIVFALILSSGVAKSIRAKNRINPLLSRYLAALWFGGIAVVAALFAVTLAVPMYPLMYLPALSFPIVGLCSLGSAVLFKSRLGYVLSGLFFAALLPAAMFPQQALLLQAVLMGGGLLLLGIFKNA